MRVGECSTPVSRFSRFHSDCPALNSDIVCHSSVIINGSVYDCLVLLVGCFDCSYSARPPPVCLPACPSTPHPLAGSGCALCQRIHQCSKSWAAHSAKEFAATSLRLTCFLNLCERNSMDRLTKEYLLQAIDACKPLRGGSNL